MMRTGTTAAGLATADGLCYAVDAGVRPVSSNIFAAD
jgi:hypothetical protein